MKIIDLRNPINDSDDSSLAEIKGVLADMKKTPGKVYRTIVRTMGYVYIFTTTTKDIHLFLGMMPESGRLALARLFRKESETVEESELLVHVAEGNSKSLFVTVTPGSGHSNFTLNPAHH